MITRVGAVPYLNGKPLVYGLDAEPDIELTTEVPSKLARMLEAREIAVGLVSSVACFLDPHLQIVPGISIACQGPVQSVRVFHRKRLEDAKTVALDTSSLTSVLLARIILRERYEVIPEFVNMPPVISQMLGACDAAVIIGDPAMRVPEGLYPDIDLGQEWHDLTGLPFVFAVWAVNPEMASHDLTDVLQQARSRGLNAPNEISASEAQRLELPFEVCHNYLTRIMDYEFTDRHMEGLCLFREKAQRYGLTRQTHPLRLFEPSQTVIGR